MFDDNSRETHSLKSNYHDYLDDPFKWISLKFLLYSLLGDKSLALPYVSLPFKLNPRFTVSTRSGIS